MVDVVFFRSPVEISTPPKNSLGPQKFSIKGFEDKRSSGGWERVMPTFEILLMRLVSVHIRKHSHGFVS